jgi:hypothetical protein
VPRLEFLTEDIEEIFGEISIGISWINISPDTFLAWITVALIFICVVQSDSLRRWLDFCQLLPYGRHNAARIFRKIIILLRLTGRTISMFRSPKFAAVQN